MVSFVYTPVECFFYKFHGINCRPKSAAKLFDRFFHRRGQVSPVVKYLTHRLFDGYYHLLDGDVAVGFHHGLASHFGAALHGGGWHLVWPADFAKPQYPERDRVFPSHSSTTNTARSLADFAALALRT